MNLLVSKSMGRGQDNIAVLLIVCDLKRKYPRQVTITNISTCYIGLR
jgi:hypothetical protein